MAIVALIISVVSVMASAAAVGVAIWTHRQQGSRITCAWGTALPVYGSQLGDRHISVTATNHGRAAATVQGWGFVLLDQAGRDTDTSVVMMHPPAWLPACPFRLEGQSSVEWMMPLADLQEAITQHGPEVNVKAFVRLGTGTRVLDKKLVRLD